MTTNDVQKQLLAMRDYKIKILAGIKNLDQRQQYSFEIRKDIEALERAVTIIREHVRQYQ